MQDHRNGRDAYQEVTDRICSALEAGTVPWRKPWTFEQAPRSLDGRYYRGVNALLLGLSEYSDPRWGTFKTVQAHGGKVRKGGARNVRGVLQAARDQRPRR